jgi:hypothetical protein
MLFENMTGGHPIDIVDIGTPNDQYGAIEASLDGQPMQDIRKSQYVHPGVEIHLNAWTIPSGGSGTLIVEIPVRSIVFQDTTRDDYASFQITPTWFGEQYVRGPSDITINVFLPEGLQAEEVLSQHEPFTAKEMRDGRVVVSWTVYRAFTGPYLVGVSFPKRVMSSVVSMSRMKLFKLWAEGILTDRGRAVVGIVSAIMVVIIFLRFTGGTGGCLLVPILLAFGVISIKHVLAQIFFLPALIILGVAMEMARRRRKSKYLPAIASVEGGGIKRGLTAPEAAVLLEFPANKVATLILFGMVKKGLIRQTSTDPIAFSVAPDAPDDTIVYVYEKEILAKLGKPKHEPLSKVDLTSAITSLIDSVVKKMGGFDLEETRRYYRSIIDRAWKEAKVIGDIEAWQKKMDEKIEWMMLDEDFGDRFRPYNNQYIPRSYRLPSPTGSTLPTGSGTTQNSQRFSDVAASFSGWLQNTSGAVVTKFEGPKGGLIDLSAMDKAMSSGGGGGRSGGGGSCACACAGCACACACAGGGR